MPCVIATHDCMEQSVDVTVYAEGRFVTVVFPATSSENSTVPPATPYRSWQRIRERCVFPYRGRERHQMSISADNNFYPSHRPPIGRGFSRPAVFQVRLISRLRQSGSGKLPAAISAARKTAVPAPLPMTVRLCTVLMGAVIGARCPVGSRRARMQTHTASTDPPWFSFRLPSW